VDAETGRFRAWLRGALRHFVQNHRRKQRARKRGGDRPGAALDRMAGQLPDARAAGPEELFDAAYKQELLARAVQAMFADYEAENRECYARVFREYYLLADGPAVPTYRQVANKLGVSEHDVTNWLAHGRARLRQKVIELVRNSVTDERGLSLELAHLRGEEP